MPAELGGQGIASYLVKYILDDAAAKNLRVKPTCSYVKSYIDKHPEYQDNSVFHNATPWIAIHKCLTSKQEKRPINKARAFFIGNGLGEIYYW